MQLACDDWDARAAAEQDVIRQVEAERRLAVEAAEAEAEQERRMESALRFGAELARTLELVRRRHSRPTPVRPALPAAPDAASAQDAVRARMQRQNAQYAEWHRSNEIMRRGAPVRRPVTAMTGSPIS